MSDNTESNNNEPKQLTNLEMIEKLQGSEELNTLINNSNKKYWNENIGADVKERYLGIDNAIETNLGLKKPEDVFTTEYYAGFIKELANTKKELDALKNSKGQENEAQTKLWNDKFNKLKGELETAKTALENEKLNGFKNNINNQIDTFLSDKKFKATYSEFDIRDLKESKKRRILENTKKLENGKTAVINPVTGEYYLDALGEPLTVAQVAAKEFESMFEVTKQGGNTPTDTTITSTEGDVLAIDMSQVKTKGDFYNLFAQKMAPKGLASHDKKYLEIQRATIAHYKINDLSF